jgi:hypothetical protein
MASDPVERLHSGVHIAKLDALASGEDEDVPG